MITMIMGIAGTTGRGDGVKTRWGVWHGKMGRCRS